MDCSAVVNKPPDIQYAITGNICDRNTADCSRTKLVGNNIDGTNATCKLVKRKVIDQKFLKFTTLQNIVQILYPDIYYIK